MQALFSRIALPLGFLLSSAAIAQPVETLTLDSVLNSIAKVVAEKVKEQNATQIVVNPITDTGDLTHTAGLGLTEKLIAKLRAEGIEPALKADLVFSGEYGLGEAENDCQRLGFDVGRLTFKVKRRNGKELVDSEKDLPDDRQPRVTDLGDLSRMGGATVSLPPADPTEKRNKALLDALENKPDLFEPAGTQIRPKGSPYAIEMLVAPANGGLAPKASAFRPRAFENREGMPFLKVQPCEVVAVRIINDSGLDAASTVIIDGLSMFAFRENKADKNEHIIIKPRSAGDVLGWFRNLKTSSAYLVADLPKDHPTSEFLKSPANIGSITVTFAAAWPENAPTPADEDRTRQATEIVPGSPIETPYESVRRQIGKLRGTVTVRYDKL
jgi:hypothetical protein